MRKMLEGMAVILVALYPLIYIKGFAFPGIFPRAIFAFLVIEALFFGFLWYLLAQKKVTFNKSYLGLAILAYCAATVLSALAGADALQSFWSSYYRMTGLVTLFHYLALVWVLAGIFKDDSWKKVFRAISIGGGVVAGFSILGADGLNLYPFSAIKEGGSLFGNTSYSGAYMLVVFFISFIGIALEESKAWRTTFLAMMWLIFLNPDLFPWTGSLGLARASTLVLWVGLLCIGVTYLLHKYTNKKVVLYSALAIVIVGVGGSLYGLSSVISGEGRIYETYIKESGEARAVVWNIAAEGIKERPLLGDGVENFNYDYQEHLNPKIIQVEASTEWFDNVHNVTLGELGNGGVVGALLYLAIFCAVFWKSFTLYFKEGVFYYTIIPFILFFHFTQMQTFFQTDSTLFVICIIFAFLISKDEQVEVNLSNKIQPIWLQAGTVVLFVLALHYFVNIPIKENRLTAKITYTKDHAERLAYLDQLTELRVYPYGTIALLSGPFIDTTVGHIEEIDKAKIGGNVAAEYKKYLAAYKAHEPRYENNYRYLIEYANLINSAYLFGIDELAEGERLARRAISISKAYPHAHWMLAVNLYRQGKKAEALEAAKFAYDIDPQIKKSKEIYDTIKK